MAMTVYDDPAVDVFTKLIAAMALGCAGVMVLGTAMEVMDPPAGHEVPILQGLRDGTLKVFYGGADGRYYDLGGKLPDLVTDEIDSWSSYSFSSSVIIKDRVTGKSICAMNVPADTMKNIVRAAEKEPEAIKRAKTVPDLIAACHITADDMKKIAVTDLTKQPLPQVVKVDPHKVTMRVVDPRANAK